jgi:hypothetical protein
MGRDNGRRWRRRRARDRQRTLNYISQYIATIGGGTAGTGYTQTQVNGQVALNGATLVLTGAGEGSGGGAIVLIESTGGVTGTFACLAEGATVPY